MAHPLLNKRAMDELWVLEMSKYKEWRLARTASYLAALTVFSGCSAMVDVGEFRGDDVIVIVIDDPEDPFIGPKRPVRMPWKPLESWVPGRDLVPIWPGVNRKRPSFAEVCNGVDDDLDGVIDNDFFVGAVCVRGQGTCQQAGVIQCDAAGGAVCSAEPDAPSLEVCNGVDNDCDGLVDEDVLNACGGCGEVPEEVCDGVDNNCDGEVDEGVANACGACGEVPEEICDGIDNDCDGELDEDTANACGECGEVLDAVCEGIDSDEDGELDCPMVLRSDPATGETVTMYLLCGGPGSDAETGADRTKSWAGAKRACESRGLRLVSINDEEEDEFLHGQLEALDFGDTWLSLNDRANEGEFVWRDQSSIDDYDNWDRRAYGDGHTEEPNDGGEEGEGCGIMMMNNPVRASFWDDRPCSNQYAYVCERALR